MSLQMLSTAVVHPLVLLNISEHTTRTLAQVKRGKITAPQYMCGAVLGRQIETKFEAFLSFELKLSEANTERAEFDLEHFTARLEQLKIIFPSYDLLGWYAVSTNRKLTPGIAQLHEQIIASHASAILMVFDAALAEGAAGADGSCSLPICVYETLAPVHVERTKLEWYKNAGARQTSEHFVASAVDHSTPTETTVWASRLVPIQVTLDSGEAERVAVEHVANVSRQTNTEMLNSSPGAKEVVADTSRMAVFLSGQRNALEMLAKDIAVLKTYVGDVINGRAEFDADVMQRVQRVLSNRAVVQNSDGVFSLAMSQEETNFQLAAYLAGITDVAASVRDVSLRANSALSYARNKHATYVSPNQGEGMFGMGGMMGGFGHGRMGRHRGFGSSFR
ncbi:COP9 signalosome complex subunit 6 [Coemansia sp. RSA 1972]|nr:COP9 signalosome complex subunit 6 [Coemansia sp. RSA 1972]